MKRHRFKNRSFSWPNKCVACGEKATDEIESKCSVVTKAGYFVLFATTTHQVTRIRYPVCHKHKMIGATAGKLSQRNLFNLGMGVMACFFLYGIVFALFQFITEGKTLVGNDFLFFETMYVLIYFGLYFWAKKNTPVKIYNATENEIELSFNNDTYGREFIALNKEIIS
jgi:hypothetical protein